MPDYPAAVTELLAVEHPTALGPGTPDEALRARIKAACAGLPPACAAGLWLRFDFLDESHRVSQEDEGNPERDFWHAVMHRREPDAFNSKYWWRRVGAHPVLRQRRWLVEPGAQAVHPSAGHRWLAPDGTDLVDADLVTSATRTFGWFLDGTRIPSTDEHGHPVLDDRLLIWCNGTAEPVEVHLPPDQVAPWRVVLDSAPIAETIGDDDTHEAADERFAPGAPVCVDAWSVRVLLSPVATS